MAACGREAPHYVVDLSGEHRHHVGDDPAFAAPDFDDSRWATLRLPASWRVRTPHADVIGWHRIRFELPASPGRLALDVGAIGWSDEVFINGQRIGATGSIDRVPRLGQWPRLYAVPDGVVHQGTNVLAIRVRGIPLGVNGLFATRIGLGDELELLRARAEALRRTQFVEGVLLGFLVTSWLVVVFFPKRGRAGRATLFLLATITLALIQLWLLSVTCREAGVNPEAGANVVLAVLIMAGCIYWAFVATITRGMLPPLIKGPIAAEVAIALLALLWPDAIAVVVAIGTLIGTGAFAVLCWMVIGAIRARTPGGIPIAFGCGLPAISVQVMLFVPQPFLLGIPVVFWGLVSAIAFAVLALTRHVHEMNRQVQRATEYSLEAHTRERGRLARDLHDGLGQMLALLKLQMQRMGHRHEGEPVQRTFDESAEQVAATLDELRRISHDLRPAPLQDRSFGEALREYAAAMAQRTDIEVQVEGQYKAPPSESVADELYRIAQECLTNCLKHSRARRVIVTLAELGDRYSLVVTDDGCGLPAEIPPGLGLATIRERSELLGGGCTITPAPGGGTRIEVKVPR